MDVTRVDRTVYAEPYPVDGFVTGAADYVEETDSEARVQFYMDFWTFAATDGREHRVGPRQLRDELATNVPRYTGANIRVPGTGYGETVLAHERDDPADDAGRLTVRAAPDRVLDDIDVDTVIAHFDGLP